MNIYDLDLILECFIISKGSIRIPKETTFPPLFARTKLSSVTINLPPLKLNNRSRA